MPKYIIRSTLFAGVLGAGIATYYLTQKTQNQTNENKKSLLSQSINNNTSGVSANQLSASNQPVNTVTSTYPDAPTSKTNASSERKIREKSASNKVVIVTPSSSSRSDDSTKHSKLQKDTVIAQSVDNKKQPQSEQTAPARQQSQTASTSTQDRTIFTPEGEIKRRFYPFSEKSSGSN